MRFGGKVHHMGNRMVLHYFQNAWFIPQVDFGEYIFGVALNRFEVLEVPRIREAIQVDQAEDFGPIDHVMNEIRADETSSTCDE
jgi:hypothetical protein